MAKPRAECGTTAGYMAHRTHGEQQCRQCLDAWNTYVRDYRTHGRRAVSVSCSVCSGVFIPTRNDARKCTLCRFAVPSRTQERHGSGCDDCGKPHHRPGSKYNVCVECSKQRQLERYRRKNRKRRAGRPGDYTLRDVGDRDGWTCHLCLKSVNPRLSGMHSRGPTVDHLIPISDGGVDELINVALAHRQCNIKRSNRGPAQLRLVG